MADAYVRYRAGGGFQKVSDYDYVLDTRQLIESGTFRDTGFVPAAIIEDAAAITSTNLTEMTIGYGSASQYVGGLAASVEVGTASTTPSIIASAPDEMMHVAPRQLSYYETSLSFFANSDTTATFTAVTAGGNLEINVADASLFAGRPVLLSGASLPTGAYPYQIYYPVATSATEMLLQTSLGGAYVPWAADGSGTVTALTQLGQFQWANILGWSNNPPSR